MNASGSKKSTCRSKESKRRRRREKRIRDKSASRSSRAEGTAKDNIESTRNVELRQRLKEEIRKRQRLQSENLDLCMKLEKRRKIDSRVCNDATYTGQLYKVIKSTKENFTKESNMTKSTAIREIDPSNLSILEEITSILGEGGFGCVKRMKYRETEVAVKFLKENCSKKQLEHEATVMHDIGDHPGVPFLYGICSKNNTYMLIMQCCTYNGNVMTLNDATESQKLQCCTWLNVLIKLTEVLSYIHMKGFIHNDLKGNNVVLCIRKQTWQPIIIDYGKCVKVSEAKAKQRSCASDSISVLAKKYPHIAPEVLCGKTPPSFSSDMYSLGVIFHKINAKLVTAIIPKDTVHACCHENPLIRPKAEFILGRLQEL